MALQRVKNQLMLIIMAIFCARCAIDTNDQGGSGDQFFDHPRHHHIFGDLSQLGMELTGQSDRGVPISDTVSECFLFEMFAQFFAIFADDFFLRLGARRWAQWHVLPRIQPELLPTLAARYVPRGYSLI